MRSRFGHAVVGAALLGATLLLLAVPSGAFASETIYWANNSYLNGKAISYASLDGNGGAGELNTTGATVNGAFGVAIDAASGRIYWANSGANRSPTPTLTTAEAAVTSAQRARR